jgi:flagellar biosynthesis/type III secretory pathway M-ring protein FliF/YscJ
MDLAVFIVSVATPILLSAAFPLLERLSNRRAAEDREPSLEERVRTLGTALADSARAIDEIEGEVRARQELVTQLEADARRYEALRELNREEVEAIAQLIRVEMRTENTRAGRTQFLLAFLQNLFFFALGVGATLVIA